MGNLNPSDEVSERVDLEPQEQDGTGTTEATSVNHLSNLVSNWYHHGCQSGDCKEKLSEFDNLENDFADLKHGTAQIPIIHHHVYKRGRWTTDSITIQDPAMRTVVGEVLRNYGSLDCELESWTFKSDLTPFVHRWDILKQLHNSNSGNASLQNAASGLITFLEPLLSQSIVSLDQASQTSLISFEDLPLIFKPGSLAQTEFFGAKVICEVVSYRWSLSYPDVLTVSVKFVDWNGEVTGYDSAEINIARYNGQCPIIYLPIFPISYLADPEAAMAEAVERGRKFQDLRGYHFKMYNGMARALSKGNTYLPRSVSGRVCVDPYAFYRSRPVITPTLLPLYKNEKNDGGDSDDKEHDHANPDVPKAPEIRYSTKFYWEPREVTETDRGDEMMDPVLSGRYKHARTDTDKMPQGISTPVERTEDLRPLSEEQLILTTPWVKGFDIAAKEWCLLHVDNLSDMKWDNEAFDKLALPKGRKAVLRSLAENRSMSSTAPNNGRRHKSISGNNHELVVLMFGPPGVGKVSTAKAVAELSRVPLYTIRASDLGPDIWDAKEILENTLKLCHMWNAILLLDKADSYLCQKDTKLKGLVPFLLSKLDDYQVMLFVSAKRLSVIDSTIESHVDLLLAYEDLPYSGRRQVWKNLINRASGREKFDFDSNEMNTLDRLSRFEFSGLHIESIVESARRIYSHTDSRVPADHLLELADIREEAGLALGDETA